MQTKTEPQILIYSIDGMNRSGKGTQLKLLKNYLELMHQIPTAILRGYGRKTGIEDNIYQNYGLKTEVSEDKKFWNKFNQDIKKPLTKHETIELWHRAGNKLEEEITTFKQTHFLPKLYKHNHNLGIILLDRSWMARFHLEQQRNNNANMASIQKNSKIHPNHYFILDATLDELEKRLLTDTSPKRDFRKKMIKENYPIYQSLIPIAQKYLGKSLTIIDANQDPKQISKQIQTQIKPSLTFTY